MNLKPITFVALSVFNILKTGERFDKSPIDSTIQDGSVLLLVRFLFASSLPPVN